jgi:hypothetical protein
VTSVAPGPARTGPGDPVGGRRPVSGRRVATGGSSPHAGLTEGPESLGPDELDARGWHDGGR